MWVATPDGTLCGCLVWKNPRTIAQNDGRTLELSRFFLEDWCPANSESRLLGVAAKLLRRMFPWANRLLSYADPLRGHRGTIYKAAGWTMTGVTETKTDPRCTGIAGKAPVGDLKLRYEKKL